MADAINDFTASLKAEIKQGLLDASRPPTVPTIPVVGGSEDPAAMQKTVRRLAQLANIREGNAGSVLDKHLTLRDLMGQGLFQLNNGQNSIPVPGTPSIGDGALIPTYFTDTRPVYLTPPPLTNLTATGTFKAVILTWDPPGYANFAYAEVWRNTTNTLGSATLNGTTQGNVYTDASGTPSTTYYYWVRAIVTSSVAGPFNAVGGTSAGSLLIGSTDLGPLIVQAANLASGAVTAGKLAANSIAVGTAAIQNGAIVNAMIANLAVDDAKISSLNATKLTANSITAAQIASGTITSTQIAANTIVAGNIAANTITTGKIVVGAATAATAAVMSATGTVASGSHASVTQTNSTLMPFTTTGAPVTVGGFVQVVFTCTPSATVVGVGITMQITMDGTAYGQAGNFSFYYNQTTSPSWTVTFPYSKIFTAGNTPSAAAHNFGYIITATTPSGATNLPDMTVNVGADVFAQENKV